MKRRELSEAATSKSGRTFPGSPARRRFAAAIYRTAITEKLDVGLRLQRIWQDLVYDPDSYDVCLAFAAHEALRCCPAENPR